MGGSDAGDVAGDGAWMTYGQLAMSRGVTRRAAVRLTQRLKLRRQPGNDGFTRVWVPADLATPSERRRRQPKADAGDVARDNPGDKPDHVAPQDGNAIKALEDAVAALRAQLDAAEERAQAEREHAEQAEQRVDAERARADRLRAALDSTHVALTAAENRAREAEEAVRALRAAEAARHRRGLLARLRAAWQGI